jgi:hypothetical protein
MQETKENNKKNKKKSASPFEQQCIEKANDRLCNMSNLLLFIP